MSATPSEHRDIPTVDIREVEDWRTPPTVRFHQAASLQIARWVVCVFGGVYALGFVLAFVMLWLPDITYDKAAELVKFLDYVDSPAGHAGGGILPRR